MTIASGQVAYPGIIPIYGTYNPTITCVSSGGYNLNASYNVLSYTKIGTLVYVQGNIQIDSESGTPSGYIHVSLPFASATIGGGANSTVGRALLISFGGSLPNNVNAEVTYDGSSFFFLSNVSDTGVYDIIDESHVDTNWILRVSIIYRSAS